MLESGLQPVTLSQLAHNAVAPLLSIGALPKRREARPNSIREWVRRGDCLVYASLITALCREYSGNTPRLSHPVS